ncbi:serine/threonine-protein kinase [Stigmatella aurantiaca]|nr:Serine/threonine protein kinase [Stigmatella aurantiaca DW4/3-1]
MGEIYLARLEGAQGFEKLCVIKRILPQLAADTEFVERFVGEARVLVKLSHGSIAQVLDMGLHEGDAYMALEYVDGKDLRKVAGRVRDRQSPLPLTFVLYVMARVLDALAYAHRKRDDDEKEINLVHRDISPQNILISYEGEVKVIDFGLAKSRLSAAKTNPSIILGKFLYMSPEQARHQQVDRRSDLYAVGLCLYELISGKNPFDNVSPGELMTAVAQPRIAPLSEVEPMTPPQVAQVVMKALAVDPAQRFQSAEEFRGKLTSCLQEIDQAAGPETVSRFMRELFAVEYQGERKLLAQLKEVPRMAEPPARPAIPSEPGLARAPNPALPPRTIRLDGPVEPLSFQPTPRSREGVPVDEGETRPGVVLDESTRPAVSLDETTAERPLPPVELRMSPPPPPPPEVESVAPGGGLSAGPPVFSPPPVPRAPEPPRFGGGPSPGGSPPRPGEPPRASPGSAARPAGSSVPGTASSGTPAYVSLAMEMSRAMMPQASARPAPPEEAPTVPDAAPAAPSFPGDLPPVPSSESRSLPPPVAAVSRAPVAPAPVEQSRRGIDDTHPSYQMLTPARSDDTHPRVVLDEAAFKDEEREDEEPSRVIVGNMDEGAPAPVRPKTATTSQRTRVSTTGMPSVPRTGAPRSGSVRAVTSESALAAFKEEGGSRDPREETRRTAMPPPPAEPPRRIHREDTRRTAVSQRPRKASWLRLAVGLGLPLLVVGGVLVALPRLKPLIQEMLQDPVNPAPPAIPLSPGRSASPPKAVTSPPPPSAPPPSEAAAPGEAAPSHAAAAPSPTEPPPAEDKGPETAAAAPPPAANPGLTAVEVAESEMFVPLTPGPPEPAAATSKRTVKGAGAVKKAARKEVLDLQRDWAQTRGAFTRLTHEHSCESPRIGILCNRFENLQNDLLELGDAYDKRTHERVKDLRKVIQQAMN